MYPNIPSNNPYDIPARSPMYGEPMEPDNYNWEPPYYGRYMCPMMDPRIRQCVEMCMRRCPRMYTTEPYYPEYPTYPIEQYPDFIEEEPEQLEE